MEAIAYFLHVSLPNYLRTVPWPKTFAGFMDLTGDQWIQLLPLITGFLVVLFSVLHLVLPDRKQPKTYEPARVNKSQSMHESKVVNTEDIEDIGEKKVFCRCWKSKKFPYCDGSHNKHNEDTGDNVGPLIVKKTTK